MAIRRMKFIKAVLFGIMLLCTAAGHLRAQVPVNPLSRVLMIKAGDALGTAFTIEVDGRQYLITARHVVAALKPHDTVQYSRNDKWCPLDVNILRYDDKKNIDVAVLVPPYQLTESFTFQPTMQGVRFGQDVYLLGFPYSLYTIGAPNAAGFPLPYIVKGFFQHRRWTAKESRGLFSMQ